MAQRPANLQGGGAGRGLQIGLALGRTPRHLPPALAPRSGSGTGKDTPSKRTGSRTGVAGIDADDYEDGLVYDEPSANAEPAMESLASSIAAARLLTTSVSNARDDGNPSVSFGGRAREATIDRSTPPADPRYNDS